MIEALLIFLFGLALSAFFSGCETGFYRATRLRLVLDGVRGDSTARGLLWASNHPEAFVATALVGNNVANYLASSAIVTAAGVLAPSAGLAGEVGLTLLLAPVVFILAELLPKRAFLQAPNHLLRKCSLGLLIAAVVLAVPSFLLWLVSRGLSFATGAQIQPLRMAVRRRELRDAFHEGEAVGLLSTAQRDLAMATFSLGGAPVRDFATPGAREPRLAADAQAADVVRLAQRYEQDAWPIVSATADRQSHFVRASRIVTAASEPAELPVEPLLELPEATPFLQALTQMESAGVPLAAVVGAGRRVVGYVRIDRLQRAFWESS